MKLEGRARAACGEWSLARAVPETRAGIALCDVAMGERSKSSKINCANYALTTGPSRVVLASDRYESPPRGRLAVGLGPLGRAGSGERGMSGDAGQTSLFKIIYFYIQTFSVMHAFIFLRLF